MAQYRAPYERSPFTPPAVLLPMDKPRGVIYHQWQKLTTLFIGGISPGVTDDWKKFSSQVVDDFPIEGMEILMYTILSNWILMNLGALNEGIAFEFILVLKALMRLLGAFTSSGVILSNTLADNLFLFFFYLIIWQLQRLVVFEFAEYADADSVLRALRVLGGEGSGDDKKVNIKDDENIRKYLAQYEASRPGTVHDTESVNLQHENKLAHRTSPATEIKTEHGEKDDDTDLPADLPLDQKDLIYREIAFFLERAAARERERQREEEERANRRAKAEKERERSHGRVNSEREREQDHDRTIKKRNNADKLKEKLKRNWFLRERKTMAI
ncbi:unnamed protein product [Rhizophagus irregularis]|nr:unnamed protein product [Rhizophagus irregularis]